MEPTEPTSSEKIMAFLTAMFLDLIQVVVMSLAIFVLVYMFIFQPNMVKGRSMEPTFLNGEYLLTDKLTYSLMRKPARGDIVVFRSPENNDIDFIKRIIALPGDDIQVKSGQVFVNGEQLPQKYLADGTTTLPGAFLKESTTYEVPPGGFVVFGDNRNHSSDSREWGPVPEDNIIGRVWFRYWPLTRMGIVATKINQEDILAE